MQRIESIQQTCFLSKNYQPSFINNRDCTLPKKRFKFINKKKVKGDIKIYKFPLTCPEKGKEKNHKYKYYVLQESDKKINDKFLHLPKQVLAGDTIRKYKKKGLIDYFDIINKKEILKNKPDGNKLESFVYADGPLHGQSVSKDIAIIHVQPILQGIYYIFIYKEVDDHIEVHPIAVKSKHRIQESNTYFEKYHESEGKKEEVEGEEEIEEQSPTPIYEKKLKTSHFFTPSPEQEKIEEPSKKRKISFLFNEHVLENKKPKIKFVFNIEKHYEQERQIAQEQIEQSYKK